MSKRILLIDLSALFHPAWRANENGPVSVAYEGTLGGVRRCISTVNPDATAICCDGKGNWRKKLAGDYKAHRDPLPPVFYAELDRVKQRLRDDGLTLWQCDETATSEGFEADDIIATACAVKALGPLLFTVATHDKDMFQLVSPTVDVLSLSTFERRDAAAVEGKFGVPPAMLGDWLALVGDLSDNVKGAPGIGPKTASKLLQQYGDLLGVFKAAYDSKSDLTPAIRKSLIENDKQIELARKLVTLRTDAPIKFEEIWEKREVKALEKVENSTAAVILATGLAASMGAAAVYPGSSKNLDEQTYFGFSGAGVEPFPEQVRAVLSEAVNPDDVEIQPTRDGLVYMSGVFYRRILTRAFGQGGWALLPRSRPTAGDGSVVWHGALICLGRYVSEAFGEHDYDPRNPKASYPTSVEAAKTDCLRRCTKDLGWSSELWSKAWIEQWKKTHAEFDRRENKWFKK